MTARIYVNRTALHRIAALGAVAALALLAAGCTTKEGDSTVTGPPAPPPTGGFITVAADARSADCAHAEFVYQVEAHAKGVPAGGTLELAYGDGGGDLAEGTDFSDAHRYVGCGADGLGFEVRATYTFAWSDGRYYQVFGGTDVDACAACTGGGE